MVSAIEPMAVVMKPAARNGFSTNSSVSQADQAGDDECDDQRGHDRQAERDVGDEAGERADGHVRGEREVGEAQHGEDRGEPDGRHRQDGAGHQRR